MSPQKDGKTTKRAPERHTEKGNNQWILERPMTTSRMGSQSAYNCNKYGYMAKECRAEKKEQETRMCFKCDKKGHIARY